MGGRGKRGEDDDLRQRAAIAQKVQERKNGQSNVTLKLEWNGPELGGDETRIGVVLEHAGQRDVHDRHDIEEEPSELRAGEILPQRQGGEDRTEDEGRQDDHDSEGRDNAYHPERQEVMQPRSLEAGGNQEP